MHGRDNFIGLVSECQDLNFFVNDPNNAEHMLTSILCGAHGSKLCCTVHTQWNLQFAFVKYLSEHCNSHTCIM